MKDRTVAALVAIGLGHVVLLYFALREAVRYVIDPSSFVPQFPFATVVVNLVGIAVVGVLASAALFAVIRRLKIDKM